ncbi:Glycine dehydrogenase [decarboxylating] (glycine cleavage system P1 protein) [Candidatus Syntrophocurvum alkaliphilum]|uniref:Probable glycine dehydrogenase (decarboxylating) subunit 1 n=1 Tax=Candidatus Syntrophocurvum alkaliphilum TaxID=2293317 RepID=A0A6I6DDJ8_9FIRM|nr:aminomethyl-transferring glycine dehydrogenase subunit GcvPA [Candidatus Syntrophocurvum alkaliphilum]QGT98882.1 Glycine dehydrogenase [decarboxylating] (glycine cleavage system P1 protein) [Candidatus Syntrophocurvum alkaliphilum]
MRFTPNPKPVVEEMLKSIGLNKIDDLFVDIPNDVKLNRDLNIPDEMSELELTNHLKKLASKNLTTDQHVCFMGAGAYDHYIPPAVDQMLLRSEFYTAYTPYQPEISQGVLQAIFEYQTMICNLTGMDVSNASMYDGGSALAEACMVASDSTRRKKILVPDSIHPEYLKTIQTYAISGKMEVVVVPSKDGITDSEAIISMTDKSVACVVIQQPNFLGNIEDITNIEKAIHENKGLLVMAVDPFSLGVLKSPREWGADIVVGEGQPFGNSLSFGGPHLGFFAADKKFMRKIPGRIAGQTQDPEGNRGFVLTLQAREQHIRREKAGSNICSNQALNALAANIYLSLIGKEGLKQLALRSHQLAIYAKEQFEKVGIKLKYNQPFLREFAISVNSPTELNKKLLASGIIGGYELDGGMLLAFTEKRTKEEIDKLVSLIGGENHG